jgi:SpoVK/Ycf46/Vps4 family AAA+-type ATPase
LLARLERFEGLTILSTNLRQNIDPAFTRRLEFVIEFDPPDRDQRLALWKCHVPDAGLLAEDVNLAELATHYPLVGGLIRNAAVAAAFLAAADGASANSCSGGRDDRVRITRVHLIRAIKREYEKSGQSFPGLPAGMTDV